MGLPNLDNIHRADCGEHRIIIPYIDDEGKTRNYFPDYLDSVNGIIYEIKMVGYRKRKYKDKRSNWEEKESAAEKYCKEMGLQYKVVQERCLSKKDELYPLRNRGIIEFASKQEGEYSVWLAEQSCEPKPKEILLTDTTKKIIKVSGVDK
jgi:hypothetical protein